MKQSQLANFIKRELPKDEESYNAQILIRAGFIGKLMAGVYSYLPLGLRVVKKIEKIIRKRIDEIGGQELLMPALTPKENWEKTGRWANFDALFKVISRDKKEYALGATHEEIIVPLSQKAIFSYKDLPMGLYQIQTKFRDEPRAKSGLLRGREFIMKDLYSFHPDKECLERYYKKAIEAYNKIFEDLGLDAKLTEASGGTFSKFSHEFQVLHENGEDTIVYCEKCLFAQNSEINKSKEGDKCPSCEGKLKLGKSIEVGNIFQLNDKYSAPFSLKYKDKNGEEKIVIMGCYGIGVSRIMGAIAEIFNDKNGLVWSENVAPFSAHLLALYGNDEKQNKIIEKNADGLYKKLSDFGIDVLFDDRREKSAGEKFVESDLVGIPVRIVISAKTGGKYEFKLRKEDRVKLVDFSFVREYFKDKI